MQTDKSCTDQRRGQCASYSQVQGTVVSSVGLALLLTTGEMNSKFGQSMKLFGVLLPKEKVTTQGKHF